MIPVELSKEADADLDSILDYSIAAHGRDSAEAYLRLIDAALDRLREFPEIGAVRFEPGKALRSLPVKEHRILYRFDGQAILVARILHRAMDVEQHLQGP